MPEYTTIESNSDLELFSENMIMKKVTSLLIAAFTTAVFAGSAMAATPAQHSSQPVKTHQIQKQHKAGHAKKHHAAAHKSATAKKVEDKAATK